MNISLTRRPLTPIHNSGLNTLNLQSSFWGRGTIPLPTLTRSMPRHYRLGEPISTRILLFLHWQNTLEHLCIWVLSVQEYYMYVLTAHQWTIGTVAHQAKGLAVNMLKQWRHGNCYTKQVTSQSKCPLQMISYTVRLLPSQFKHSAEIKCVLGLRTWRLRSSLVLYHADSFTKSNCISFFLTTDGPELNFRTYLVHST
jgi:hypothetical protein